MRRILKATTAIVTSISLVLPQIAVAQGQGGQPQDQIVLPKKKEEQQKKPNPQREQQRAQPKQEQKPAPKREAQSEPRKKPQPQRAREEQPQRQQHRAEEPRRQPQAQRQQQDDAQPRRQQQAEKPALPKPQREEQPRRDAAQPQRENAAPTPQQRVQKPADKPTVVDAAEPQRRPEQRDAGRDQSRQGDDRPAPPKPAEARRNAPQPDELPPNAQALRRAMEEREQKRDDAPRATNERPEQRGDQQRNDQQRNDQQRADQQRDQQQRRQNGQQNRDAANRDDAITPEELRQRLQRGDGETRLPAPETRQRPNDVARRAAEGGAIPAAAALAAGRDDARGEVVERRITNDNVRRANQDFRTRIEDGLRETDGRPRNAEARRALEKRERELDRRERDLDRRDDARDDDDDDNGNDIAKLLLAGAAGFAVGKMLSNNRQVALNTGDRAVLTLPDGSQQIVRDDNALLYQPGSDVRTESFQDGSTRTTVLRADGSRVVTIRDADTNILRRTLIRPDGSETLLINDTEVRPVQVSTLPAPQPVEYSSRPWNESELRDALLRESAADRRFSLGQIRDIPEVRSLVAPVNVPEITFDTGSAALSSTQADQLATLGKVIRDSIDDNPNEVFMIEGYTDAVGSNAANLALSDRRAESVALALTEYFQVPPENMVVQGYGEQFMLVPSDGAERENRRVAVRRITDLLAQSGS